MRGDFTVRQLPDGKYQVTGSSPGWGAANNRKSDQVRRVVHDAAEAETVRADLDAWLAFVRAQEGQTETNLRPWNANLFTAYDFTSGLLKGVTIGGGVNYRGEAILGTVPATVANPESISTRGRSYYTGTGMLGYKFRLQRGVDVKLQLNVQNLFNNDDKQVLASNWNPGLNGGQGGFQLFEYYFEPRSYSLTATFSF